MYKNEYPSVTHEIEKLDMGAIRTLLHHIKYGDSQSLADQLGPEKTEKWVKDIYVFFYRNRKKIGTFENGHLMLERAINIYMLDPLEERPVAKILEDMMAKYDGQGKSA